MSKTAKAGTEQASRRWALCSGFDIGIDGDPYLDRLRIIQTPWFGWYLHKIHRPDADQDPHDHPWRFPLLGTAFFSMVLCGSYTEVIWPDKRDPARSYVRTRRRFSVHAMSWRSAHAITGISGSLWTTVFTGRRHRDGWGFWVPVGAHASRFVPWREYITNVRGSAPSPRYTPSGVPLAPAPELSPDWVPGRDVTAT